MLPTLFSIGPITVYSYGLFLAIGFLAATYVIWKKALEANFEEEEIFDAVFLVTTAGLVGARLYYIFLHWPAFKFNFTKWFLVTRYPGLAVHGALLLGFLALYRLSKRRKWSFWTVADFSVLGLTIGQVIGRIGCFLNGCCWGVPTNLLLGIKFPGSLYRRHPTQLYEAFLLIFVFWLLNRVYQRYRFFSWYKGKKDEAQPGLTMSLYLIFYGLARFLIEFLRDDSVYWGRFKSAQILSLSIILFGVVLGYLRSGRELREDWQGLTEKIKKLKIRS